MAGAIPGGNFPWGTKGNLNRVGDKLRAGDRLTEEDGIAFESWRASHFNVMNAFNAMLRNRARGLPITIAQRHKRRVTIVDKLFREPDMQLARMDDVAGIRLIFNDVPALRSFRDDFLKSKHNHDKKNQDDKYDYLKMPKASGYRGIHDVYAYKSMYEPHSFRNGTMIEVQYRRLIPLTQVHLHVVAWRRRRSDFCSGFRAR